ncbi:RlpA-like double-psi beta-barrel-protein domain-containing protein-containing protein [Aspergillus multicolor]|uniref:RlpA-like double-psi beta-barrel domain-containing protein n=1 Tax=Aspergillus multicolor TaxID=41759 RepID=UPI003CCCEC2D
MSSSLNGPPSGVPKRKPVPNVAVAAPPSIPDSSSDLEKTAEPAVATESQPAAPQHKLTLWQQLQQRWSQFSTKKKRIIIGALIASVALLALIIGLAVGLTKRHGKGSNDPLPTSNGGPYTGELTYYDPGLGSCGITSTASEKICAVSHVVFDATLTSGNPNENPLCGLKLRIRRGDSSVDVKVVDRCPGCNVDDLDVSSSVFEELGDLVEGRVTVQWAWLDETPVAMG